MAMNEKPKCPLLNADGNIFNLLGMASRTLWSNVNKVDRKKERTKHQSLQPQ